MNWWGEYICSFYVILYKVVENDVKIKVKWNVIYICNVMYVLMYLFGNFYMY